MKIIKLVILNLLFSFAVVAQLPQKRFVEVWSGYRYFIPKNFIQINTTTSGINLGDTLVWDKYIADEIQIFHTISSDTIPDGALSFDFQWGSTQVDTLFTYIPTKPGMYKYKCKPHSDRTGQNFMFGKFYVAPTSLTGINEPEIMYSSTQMLYPNPAKNVVNVPLNKSIKYSLAISNAKGETLKTIKVENTELYELEVSHLPSGFYYVNAGFCGCSTPKKGCTGAKRSFRFLKE